MRSVPIGLAFLAVSAFCVPGTEASTGCGCAAAQTDCQASTLETATAPQSGVVGESNADFALSECWAVSKRICRLRSCSASLSCPALWLCDGFAPEANCSWRGS